jgi:hypothetical protein
LWNDEREYLCTLQYFRPEDENEKELQIIALCVWARVLVSRCQLMSQQNEFHETWYERYATGEITDTLLCKVSYSVTVSWLLREIVRLERNSGIYCTALK